MLFYCLLDGKHTTSGGLFLYLDLVMYRLTKEAFTNLFFELCLVSLTPFGSANALSIIFYMVPKRRLKVFLLILCFELVIIFCYTSNKQSAFGEEDRQVKYESRKTRIAVIGGGNIGTQVACVCAIKGYTVNVNSSKPELYNGTLEIVDENNNVSKGNINLVTSSMRQTIEGCQIIFVTHPAFRLKEIANQMLPYIKKDMNIGVLPGTGGAEYAFRECIKKGATLFGLQRVPSVARLEQYGRRVRCEGLRSELFLASIPNSSATDLAEFMSDLWGIPCHILPNYLSVTLTPSNPILHTTRLRTLFSDYYEGKVYERNPLFYGEWSDDSSELLISCDSELQKMLKIMNKLDLNDVKSLKLHYESDTVEAMTAKLRSIKSLHNLLSPMKYVGGGWIPDFSSRYFTADFPYGLAIIEELAEILNYDAPNIRETMDWYRKVTGDTNKLNLKDYGINDIEDIYDLY